MYGGDTTNWLALYKNGVQSIMFPNTLILKSLAFDLSTMLKGKWNVWIFFFIIDNNLSTTPHQNS